jgi:hypothetical protein
MNSRIDGSCGRSDEGAQAFWARPGRKKDARILLAALHYKAESLSVRKSRVDVEKLTISKFGSSVLGRRGEAGTRSEAARLPVAHDHISGRRLF